MKIFKSTVRALTLEQEEQLNKLVPAQEQLETQDLSRATKDTSTCTCAKPEVSQHEGFQRAGPSDSFDLSKISFQKSRYQMVSPHFSRRRVYSKNISYSSALQVLELFRRVSGEPEQEIAIRGFTLLMQGGGTNKSKRGLRAYVGKYTFDLNLLKKVMHQLLGELVTVRQLARTLNREVLKIAVAEEIQGPLVYELQKVEGAQLTEQDYPYCNEIFVNNPNTPEHVRQLIRKREQVLQQIARYKSKK